MLFAWTIFCPITPTSSPPGDKIHVSRPGGSGVVDGVSVRAVDPRFELFRLGEKYVLFPRTISDTQNNHAHQATALGTWRIENGKVIPSLRELNSAAEPSMDLNEFLYKIQSAIQFLRSSH